MKRMSLCIMLLPILTGCVAAWGGAHKVKEQNESGITIQYDSALTSSAMIQKMAINHCDSLGKTAEIIDAKMPGLLLGIIEENYACVQKTSAN
jgi:hypothetical protein